MNTRFVAATFGCLVVTAALHAAQDAPGQQQPPTFRSGVQLIEADVTVRNAKGQLVRDLTRDDFELFEDGVRQDVSSFQLVDLPIQLRQPPRKGVPETIDADVDSNANSGRVYVMLLDNPPGVPFSHIYLTQRTARRFVDQALAPDDLMAIIDIQDGYGSQAFTHSRQRLLAAIDRFGRSAIGDFAVFDAERRFGTENSYDTIRFVAERLGSIGNRRKAIIWIGGVVPFIPTMASDAFAYRDAIRAAARNNVAIYPVDPHGLTNTMGRAELERLGALRAVAEDSGGYAVVNTNNFSGGYRRIVEESSTYYVLGYYPAIERTDGRFHEVKVRVKRPALFVRSRKGYLAPSPASAAAERRPLPQGLSTASIDALRSVVPINGLPLTMFAAPFKGTGGGGSVLLGARLRGADLKLDAEDRIEISQIAIDGDSRIHPGMRRIFSLNLRPDSRQQIANGGLQYFDRLDLPPGRHEIRLVVTQPGGSTGSIVTHVDVPDFVKAPLALSGLVIASENETAPRTLLQDAQAARALSTDPTVSRRFSRSDVLTVWAEVYSGLTPSAPVKLTSRLGTNAQPPVISREQAATPAAGADRGTTRYLERFALSQMTPGAYVLTVEAATADGKLKVSRQVPFEVSD